ncbi:MAG TPA: hypothetical protein VGF70_15550 [Solirubrobacteraceae bacterium]
MQTPSSEHLEFDELCREIDDFQPLPELIVRRGGQAAQSADHNQEADAGSGTFDPLILAGLVSPV